MKKHTRIFAFVLALSMLLLTGCNFKKTYTNVEEWYNDNPLMSTIVEGGIAASEAGDQLSFKIENNTVIYGVTLEEELFGVDPEFDAEYAKYFDQVLEEDASEYTSIIDDLAELSGIPASQISVCYEVYNPGASTPGYSKTFTK